MSADNQYGWMAALAAQFVREEQRKHRKSHLSLVTTEPPKAERKQRMKPTAGKATPQKGTTTVRSKRLSDEARVVYNALEAVRSLTIPSGTGGREYLEHVGRNQFIDLLEIINSRLGAALDEDETCH